MKRTTIIATLLTFLSFLLILTAALVFTLQGRQSLRRQLAGSEEAREELGKQLVAVESTRAFQADGLATAQAGAAGAVATWQAEAADLSRQLTAEAASATDLEATLTGVEGTLEAAQATMTASAALPPTVLVVEPTNGALLPPGEPVSILVSASDPAGVAALNVTVGDDTVLSLEPADEPLVTARGEWEPPAEGVYTLSASAANTLGRVSEPITVTFQVASVSADPNAEIRARVEQNVIQIRGLEPLRPITPTLLSSDALRTRVTEDLSDYTEEEARDDALVLSAFGFVTPDVDLQAIYTDFYSEEILGFYDTETAEFVVVSDDDGLDAGEQWTHAHEFVHALQDQYYELELLEDEALDSEASFALRALAEGDATLVQLLYYNGGYFSPSEQAEVETFILSAGDGPNTALPPVLEHGFAFPYDAGFFFVLTLYQQGGYPTIDAVWQNLPQSTEQILHPERYAARDLPEIVTLPPLTDTLGVGWRLLDEDVLGEFYTREYLGQHVSQARVDLAATGWGGDRYAVYVREADQALVMVLRGAWDTLGDATEFAAVYRQVAGNLTGKASVQAAGMECWQGDYVVCLQHAGTETLVVRAPDLTLVDLLAPSLPILPGDA